MERFHKVKERLIAINPAKIAFGVILGPSVAYLIFIAWLEIVKVVSIVTFIVGLFWIWEDAAQKREAAEEIPRPQIFDRIEVLEKKDEQEKMERELLSTPEEPTNQSKYIDGQVQDLTRGVFEKVDETAVKEKLAEIYAQEKLKPNPELLKKYRITK